MISFDVAFKAISLHQEIVKNNGVDVRTVLGVYRREGSSACSSGWRAGNFTYIGRKIPHRSRRTCTGSSVLPQHLAL